MHAVSLSVAAIATALMAVLLNDYSLIYMGIFAGVTVALVGLAVSVQFFDIANLVVCLGLGTPLLEHLQLSLMSTEELDVLEAFSLHDTTFLILVAVVHAVVGVIHSSTSRSTAWKLTTFACFVCLRLSLASQRSYARGDAIPLLMCLLCITLPFGLGYLAGHAGAARASVAALRLLLGRAADANPALHRHPGQGEKGEQAEAARSKRPPSAASWGTKTNMIGREAPKSRRSADRARNVR